MLPREHCLLQSEFVSGWVVDLFQRRHDLVEGRRCIKGDRHLLGVLVGLYTLHASHFAEFALDSVGAMTAANAGHNKGLGSPSDLLIVEFIVEC